MEARSRIRVASPVDTVLLLDNYAQESALLHDSLRLAGFTGPVLVVEDDGFLPEDVISIYQYFSGDFFRPGGASTGKPLYFNQIRVPDYWEISGNNTGGSVHDLNHERGRIFYAEPKHKRLVRAVDWLDEKGTVRSSDHYNRYGALYARTFFNKSGKRFCKAYFDAQGRETLVENFVTHDIILNRDGRVYVYKNKVDLICKILEELGALESRLFYNSLSTPLFVSERLPSYRREDVLFWQEGERGDIPGNMQWILNGGAKRTSRIYVQKRESYRKLIELGASGEMLKPLGFAYAFKRENRHRSEALICTNSDRIEGCEELLRALPHLHFHIAALTEMSSKLMDLSRYENVTLYPGARVDLIAELFEKCDYYLDINHESEIVSAVGQAFLHNLLIVAFPQTLHNRTFVAPEHVFTEPAALISFLNAVMGDSGRLDAALSLQRQAAMTEEIETIAALFG